MSKFDQRGQHVGRDQINAAGDININSPVTIAGMMLWDARKIRLFFLSLLEIILISSIVLSPLFPPILRVIAENAMDPTPSASLVVTFMAVVVIGLCESLPLFFGVVVDRWNGFVVGCFGILLGGFLANPLATWYYPTKKDYILAPLHSPFPWFGLLFVSSILIGLAAFFTVPTRPVHLPRTKGVRGSICFLVIAMLLSLLLAYQPQLFAELYPLLHIYGPLPPFPAPSFVYALLFVMPGMIFLLLLLLFRHTLGTWRKARQQETRDVQSKPSLSRSQLERQIGMLLGVLVLMFVSAVIIQACSTLLPGRPPFIEPQVTLSFTVCDTCEPVPLIATINAIAPSPDGMLSIWDFTFTNNGSNGVCVKNTFTSTSITLTDAFYNVYQAQPFLGQDTVTTIEQGQEFPLKLLYPIALRPGQHLKLTISLAPVSCSRKGSPLSAVSTSSIFLF